MIKFVDMFSGIGGFREGLTRAGGFTCVGHCEIDKYANRSYNALFGPVGIEIAVTTAFPAVENGHLTVKLPDRAVHPGFSAGGT